MLFDNLEYISIDNQTTDFPKHFHETFCVSLIHSGIEQIDFESQTLYSEKGSISIANPYEIHSNPLIDKDSQLKFDTVYISSDLMKYVLNGRNITFINKKLTSERVNQQFAQLTDALASRNPKAIASLLEKLIGALKFYSCENEQVNDGNFFRDFKEINSYIENNIEERFCLDELSKMANINKYGFVKKFKASTGMTPMNYILMKKIFSCKNLIQPHSELTELAYRYGFSDLPHFSRTFKSYVGISPKNYQSNLIQDS